VVDYYILADEDWDIFDIQRIISNNLKLKLSDSVAQKVAKNRSYLEKVISSSSSAIYGINTGFGSLCRSSKNYFSIKDKEPLPRFFRRTPFFDRKND